MASNQNRSGAPAPRPRKRKRRSVVGAILSGVVKFLGTLLLIGVCTGAILACFAAVYVQSVIIPQTKQVLESSGLFDVSQSSYMYYTDKSTGERVEMLTLHGSEDRVWVEYKDIPQNLINATIAIEDQRFRTHQGVDWKRTAAGVVYMFTGQDIQGGSTITQQLIKNLTQYDDVTVKRKILEIFTALEFEKSHSKDDILEWYLNYIYLGDSCNGVYTASLNYFGKEVQDLTLAECASLISITNNPSIYNPYRNPEKNLERRNLCLRLMCEQGMISEAERDAAQAEPLNLKRETGTSREVEIFTWYEDQVINDVLTDLVDKYNISKEVAVNMIYYGGLSIDTCFDPEVQAYVDAVYNDRAVLELDSKTGQEIQSAITVIDNQTGYVVAMSGGIGEKEKSRIFNRATDTIRPPGSSIKPLAVYAPALELGAITPATVFDDMPIDLNGEAWPKNSYNYYKGLTTVHEAVEDSVNTIAVKVLRDLVTPYVSYQYLTEKFGITSLVAAREKNGQVFSDIDLAPLALGGLTDGVSTYDMAAAYATFANNGMYRKPRTYLRVTDANGNVLLENTAASDVVLKESTTYYMNTMLENVVDAGTGRKGNFSNTMDIAGKTGTTTSNNDKWFVGYTPYYTAACWVGYDIQERIPSDSYLAVDMWRKVMEPLHAQLADAQFHQPDNLVTLTYCRDSGMIATEWCTLDARGPRVVEGSFISGDQPTQYCTVHVPQQICLDSPILNANGEPTGAYHASTENCPYERLTTVALLDYLRFRVKEDIVARDDAFLKSTLEALENAGACDVHNHAAEPEYDPSVFDPLNPITWPTNDPDFDPSEPSTWPKPETEEPGEEETDDGGFDPLDPTTWPEGDSDFDPLEPTTWPALGEVVRNWLN